MQKNLFVKQNSFGKQMLKGTVVCSIQLEKPWSPGARLRVEGALVKELLGKQQDVQVVGFLWGTVLLKLKIQRQNANPHR